MLNPMSSILHKNSNREKIYNIICSPTHERYETGLAATGHNFYAYRAEGIKDWNTKYGNIPSNYILLDNRHEINQIPPHIKFDFALSQNKFGQYQVLSQIARRLHIPLISLEHTLPVPQWGKELRDQLANTRGTVNVFISSFSIKEWGFDESDPSVVVIKHMVDREVFNQGEQYMSNPPYNNRENVILSVVNDWINRDWCCNFSGWQRITNGLPVKVLGDTEGLSKPAKTTEELANTYRNSRVFLNTSTISPVPTALLEAMSCGCACVSTATCMIPEVIEHGVDGFISNDENELREYCIRLLKDKKLADTMGYNAAEKIKKKFSKDAFLSSWNKLFDAVASAPYLGEF